MHRVGDGLDAVLAQNDDARAGRGRRVDELATDRVDRAKLLSDLRVRGTETLQRVVEVRQVHQGERRVLLVHHDLRRVGDPAT